MTAKIFRSTLAVALVVLLCSVAVIIGISYDYFDAMQRRQLGDDRFVLSFDAIILLCAKRGDADFSVSSPRPIGADRLSA